MIIRGDATHRQRVRERLLSRAVVDLTGPRPVDDAPCWFFSGKPHKKTGYCQFSVDSQKGLLAHRVAYELWRGEIPDGYEIDHMCHPGDGSCPAETCPHRRCCNPAHLGAVTRRANQLRSTSVSALNAVKTHCPKGHPYDETNTGSNGRPGNRACKTCAREKRRLRVAAGLVKYEPRPVRTHCKRGHERTPENTYTAPGSGKRQCRACIQARSEQDRGKSQEDDAA